MDPNCLKPLMKQAFPELPNLLLERNTKGDYTTDIYHGYQENYDQLRKTLKTMRLADLGIINLKQFHETMEKMNMGLYVPLWEFNLTIAVEMWLRKLGGESHGSIPYCTEGDRGDFHSVGYKNESLLCIK